MAAFSCYAIELLLCTTRLRLSECYNRNGSDTDGIHFQVITTIAYLFCLWGLGYCNVTLAAYWAVEYLYVILLGTQSVIYLKYKQY